MTAQSYDVEAAGWRDVAAIVLRNWRGEIVAMLDAMPSAGRRAPVAEFCLDLSQPDAVLTQRTGGSAIERGRFARSASGAEALQAALARIGAGGRRCDAILRFDDTMILRAQIRLPRTSRGALRGAVSFELDRLSPVPQSDLYFDHIEANRDKTSNRIEIVSRALRRRVVDDGIEFARMAGLCVAGIQMGDDAEPADWRWFPIDRAALLRAAWRRWGAVALAGLAAILMAALLAALAARGAAQDDQLDARIADAEMRAAVVQRLAHKMDRIRDSAAFVVRRKTQTSFVATLSALTDALPNGTWLTDVQMDSGKLHIQGFSHAASGLIARLDRSGHFSNSQFAAPLVRNDSDGTERFDLTARVDGAR